MAKSKFETHVLPNLERIEQWAREGATAKDIAKKLRIAYSLVRIRAVIRPSSQPSKGM